ncbi:MAG TPA: ParB/RepB/Spo0J family partition protein [Thermomicrobiaceae bacterium]|nr:ParB/RepB/Spo0J family partition protein [Thermomicrobiaceae bacterium]
MSETMQGKRRRFTVDALFSDTTPRAVGVSDLPNAKEIQLERIVPDPQQPRRSFDAERLEELAESIRREGVLQPIAVRYDRAGEGYIILHGERRWRAARLAGLRAIPAVVREVAEERRLVQQLMENVVREDLNAIDRAAALRALKAQMDDAPWERVAEAVGIRRSRLFQLLGTEKLTVEVQEHLRAGRLSEKQSRALQGLPAPAQEALAELIVDDGVSLDDARQLARAARDDEALAALDREGARAHLRGLRDDLDGPPRPAPRRTPVAKRDEVLRRLLGADAEQLAEAGPVTLDEVNAHIDALAVALARLSPHDSHTVAERLRVLRELIGVVVG